MKLVEVVAVVVVVEVVVESCVPPMGIVSLKFCIVRKMGQGEFVRELHYDSTPQIVAVDHRRRNSTFVVVRAEFDSLSPT